jgi:hypothetical protein
MPREYRDEIVVERTWRSGVEMVSRVNWSQVARVRRSLGLGGPHFTPTLLPAGRPRLKVVSSNRRVA